MKVTVELPEDTARVLVQMSKNLGRDIEEIAEVVLSGISDCYDDPRSHAQFMGAMTWESEEAYQIVYDRLMAMPSKCGACEDDQISPEALAERAELERIMKEREELDAIELAKARKRLGFD